MELSTRDEPVTPAGRLFLQPQLNQVINCAISLKNPLHIEAIKTELSTSFMVKHPRFSSLLVVDEQGKEFWRKTQVNLDAHIIIHENKTSLSYLNDQEIEENINSLLADFSVSSPLSTQKPLWEIHLFSELRCGILRLHHALGDGISLMSLFLASCKSLDGKKYDENVDDDNKKGEKKRVVKKGLVDILKGIWWTILAVIEFTARILWLKDVKTAISGGDGVELWPRLAATAKFSLDDMKVVKSSIPNAEGLKITGLAMVNLRSQPGLQDMSKLMEENSKASWGNKFGMILLPIYCHAKDDDPVNYVKRAKVMIDKKKQSLESHFSYNIGRLVMSLFGPKVACFLNYRIICNTTFTLSNMIGPQEQLSFADNPVTCIRATSCGLPHAVTMHMVSYAGMANMQILVAKEIIPDPKFLAKCFEDALLEIKNAAMNVVS